MKLRRVQVLPAEHQASDGGETGLYRLVARRGQIVADLCGHAHEGHEGAWACREARERLADGV